MNELLAINGGMPYRKTPFPQWPVYDDRELDLLKEVLESRKWWRVTGTKVVEFENKFSELQGTKYCLAVTSGTHALEISLMALGVGEGDEVIIPAFSFISTGSAVVMCGAIPVFVDVDPNTYCMLPYAFEKAITKKTKAVIPVHIAGHACEMDEICNIARKHNIKVIEDSAHGHGGEWKKNRLGSMGDIGIFSFQNGKLMTCGEGGCIVTNDSEIYEKAYLIHGVGRPKNDKYYNHLVMGTTCRMSEFHAAVLLAQMERINIMNKLRETNAAYLDNLLEGFKGIKSQGRNKDANIVTHYMYMFYYDSLFFHNMTREKFVEALNAEGIPAFIAFPVISDTEFFRKQKFCKRIKHYDYTKEANLCNARLIAEKGVWLPHYTLEGSNSDLEDIVGSLRKIQNITNSY